MSNVWTCKSCGHRAEDGFFANEDVCIECATAFKQLRPYYINQLRELKQTQIDLKNLAPYEKDEHDEILAESHLEYIFHQFNFFEWGINLTDLDGYSQRVDAYRAKVNELYESL